jgi:CHAT domain-containing protein/tetratricopeptide (TPR) repeat protein
MLNKASLLLIAVILYCTCCPAFAQQAANYSAKDEAALRNLIVRYFDAYAKKDLDALAALWSNESPVIASRREMLRRMFGIEDYKFSEPVVSRIKIEGDRASSRVVVERSATSVSSNVPSTRNTAVRADLSFVRENGEWKLFDEKPAVSGLVAAMAATKTDAEREALLTSDPELVTRELLFLLSSQSDSAYASADHSRAQTLLLAVLLVAEKLGDKKEAANAWMNLGIIHFVQRRFQQSLDAYQKGLVIEGELGRRSEQARLLTSIGLVHSALGKTEIALDHFQRGLAIHEELNEKSDAAQTLENIGNLHYEQGNYTSASEFYQKSVKWYEAAGAKNAAANRLLKVAKTEYEQGNDAAAIDFYNQAVSRYEAAGDKRSIGYALHNLANIYYSQGDYPQAMSHYRKSLKAEEEAGTRQGVAAALQGIGLIHSLNGNYTEALETYCKNLNVAQSLNDKAAIAAAFQIVGGAHFSLGEIDQALEAYKQALVLREELSDTQETANALIDVGITYASKAEYLNALDAYQQSKALYESVGSLSGVAAVLLNECMISFGQRDYAKTIELAQQAAVLAKQAQEADLFWQARYRVGKAQYRLEKLDLARQAFVEAIATVETLRPQQHRGQQPRFYESKLAPYLAMVDVAISEGKGNEAFDYAQRAKSRILLGVLQSAKVWITKTLSSREKEQERKFLSEIAMLSTQLRREQERQNPNRARITDLSAKLQKIQNNYAAFRTRLLALHPQLKVLRGEGKPMTSAQVAALLNDAKTALLEFVETDENTYLFAFTKNQQAARGKTAKPVSPLKIYVLGANRAELYGLVSKFQELIAGRDVNIQSLARELYDLLLKPAREQLAAQKHLVIAPDAILWNLPFQALRSEDDHYLIENCAVSYVPSLTALGAISRLRARPRARAKASPALLVFGNPVLSPSTSDRIKSFLPSERPDQLPDAQNEIERLNRLYAERLSVAFTDVMASEERLKAEAGKYQFLHLAVRGVLDETAPLFSFTAFSSSAETKDDGRLEVREILDLDLKAETVVMPATELALPKAGAIRAMTALTWSWFIAGCPSSLASQWHTESPAAAELMFEFHRNLKNFQQKQSKAQSWQSAVQQLLDREEYRHPYFWAGFAMLGDAR